VPLDAAGTASTSSMTQYFLSSYCRRKQTEHTRCIVDAIVSDQRHKICAPALRYASPQWTSHTHATHALPRGSELTTVRDHQRHESISTISFSVHTNEIKRVR
jgi:hypothetical protein